MPSQNQICATTVARFKGGTPMTVNYNYSGDSDLAPGSVVMFAGRPMISSTGIKNHPSEKFNAGLAVGGGWYEINCKAEAGALATYPELYWDATNSRLTNSGNGLPHFGYAMNTGKTLASGAEGKIFAYHCPNGSIGGSDGVPTVVLPITPASEVTPTQDTLTDSTGGTAGTTLAAPASTDYTTAELKNIIASLAAQLGKVKADVAAVISALQTVDLMEDGD